MIIIPGFDGAGDDLFSSNILVMLLFGYITRKHYLCSRKHRKCYTMGDNKMTREEIVKRWSTAKETKRLMVEKMKNLLYEDYKLRIGEEPLKFNVL